MAQNRLNKAGSIFTRVDGLLKSGLLPQKEKPLWYDIYKRFPPKRDPVYRTILSGRETPKLPSKIFYQEDEIRVFYGKYLYPKPKPSYLNSNIVKPISEIFAQTYIELAEKGISKENLVRATMEELKSRGHNVYYNDERPEQENLSAETATSSQIDAISTEPIAEIITTEEDKVVSQSLIDASLRADDLTSNELPDNEKKK